MRILRRVSGATAILLMLAGCTVGTHEPVVIPTLPACDKILLKLNHLDSSLSTKAHISQATPGPMRFCRFRWDYGENKLALFADITRPLAPTALLYALSQLKTVNELYGVPNPVFGCTPGHGNVDVVILRAATGSELTIVEVQRDGCREVIVTHAGFVTYIAYMPTASLLAQLDVIAATAPRLAKYIPKIRVTPSTNLRDGERIFVQVSGAYPGERFRVSECASAAAANINGCGDQLALQPFIDTDPFGAGSTTFVVKAKAATKPYNTTAFRPCTDQCVIMAAGASAEGTPTFVYAPLRFSK